jgi:hypothetical protein
MKSMFGSSWFGRQGIQDYLPSPNGIWLGQAAMPDQSDTAGLASGIEGFIAKLPPELLGTYNAKYQACMNQVNNGGIIGLATGAKCLYDLYKELDNLAKNGPPKAAVLPAPAAEFPVLPVVLGVVGLGVLVWGLTRSSSSSPKKGK